MAVKAMSKLDAVYELGKLKDKEIRAAAECRSRINDDDTPEQMKDYYREQAEERERYIRAIDIAGQAMLKS